MSVRLSVCPSRVVFKRLKLSFIAKNFLMSSVTMIQWETTKKLHLGTCLEVALYLDWERTPSEKKGATTNEAKKRPNCEASRAFLDATARPSVHFFKRRKLRILRMESLQMLWIKLYSEWRRCTFFLSSANFLPMSGMNMFQEARPWQITGKEVWLGF